MQYLEQIEIKQGYFPESLNGLENIFSYMIIIVALEVLKRQWIDMKASTDF